jgi:hypothetical protein
MNTPKNIIRQGDVLLTPVLSLPVGLKEVPLDKGRIVLAYGEVTGHAHAIADHTRPDFETATGFGALDAHDRPTIGYEALPPRAGEMAIATIARAKTKARLWQAPTGERYLEVVDPVTLKHEEHTPHIITPGFYQVPTQVEYTPAELRRVAD